MTLIYQQWSQELLTPGAGDLFALTSILSYLKFDPVYWITGNCAGGIASNIRGHSSTIKKDLLRFIETKLK